MYFGSADVSEVRKRIDLAVRQSEEKTLPKPRDHPRGWVVVLGSFMVQLAVFGTISSFPVFTDKMEHDPSLHYPTRRSLSVVNSVASGAGMFIGFLGGYIVDRVGPRPLIAMTTVLMALSMLLPAFVANSSDTLLVTFAIPIALCSGVGNSPLASAVGNWFDQKLPLAMGISAAGGGIGTLLVPFIAGVLAEKENGWRLPFKYLSTMAAWCLVATFLIFPRVPPKREGASLCKQIGLDLKHAFKLVRSRAALIILLMGFSFGFVFFGIIYVLVPLCTEFGKLGTPYAHSPKLSVETASSLFLWFGGAQTIGSFVLGAGGWLLDPSTVYILCGCLGALGCIGLSFCREYYQLTILSTFLGFALSGNWAMYPTFLVDHFSGPVAGVMMGFGFASIGGGALAGPTAISALASYFARDYTWSLILTAIVSVVGSAICFFLLPDPSVDADGESDTDAPKSRGGNSFAALPTTTTSAQVIAYTTTGVKSPLSARSSNNYDATSPLNSSRERFPSVRSNNSRSPDPPPMEETIVRPRDRFRGERTGDSDQSARDRQGSSQSFRSANSGPSARGRGRVTSTLNNGPATGSTQARNSYDGRSAIQQRRDDFETLQRAESSRVLRSPRTQGTRSPGSSRNTSERPQY
jgi:MFS family permease